MDYSLIITAWKEPQTIKVNLKHILDPLYNNLLKHMEIILVCPDEETYKSAQDVIDEFNFPNFVYIKDPGRGKPYALNLVFNQTRGKNLIFTDGDVVIDKFALNKLINKLKSNQSLGAVTGRPVSADTKNTMFGYWGNLLVDGAHFRRLQMMQGDKSFVLVSGYLYAMKKFETIHIPENVLDDDYITNLVLDRGLSIGYEPEARVFVKLPQNFSDWIKQKRRNLSYSQNSNSRIRKSRSFIEELKLILFPLKYARNPKEMIYSLALYPARLWLWLTVIYQNKIQRKSLNKVWQRIESTK